MKSKENLKEKFKLLHLRGITYPFALAILFSLIIVFYFSFKNPADETTTNKESNEKIEITIQKANAESSSYLVEVADSPQERSRGLMDRDFMDENEGMLFIFPDSKPRSFWMKNTKISLDILYFNENFELVNIHENTVPFNEELRYPSVYDSKYVLELNAGISKKSEIGIGDKLIIK